jgi:Uma2 family endonuclease
MSSAMHEWPRRHRITVENYHRMAEVGVFARDERVELINGEIIDMPPIGSRHAGTAAQLAELLTAAVGHRAMVRTQWPVRLNDDTEVQPDISVVRVRDDYYRAGHPSASDVLLLVEVSDSTLRYDREVKVSLYARCGIPEVWIVDLQGERIHFHRTPAEGRYTTLSSVESPGVTAIGSLPGICVDLSKLKLD